MGKRVGGNYFEKYVRKMVETLKDYVSYWMTINEPNVYAFLSYLTGEFPPGKKDLSEALRVLENLIQGHSAAYHAIHEIQPAARVGIAHQYRGANPLRAWSPFDHLMSAIMKDLFNEAFPRALKTGVFTTIPGKKAHPPGQRYARLCRHQLLYQQHGWDRLWRNQDFSTSAFDLAAC
jgi:beta-glucosidase/6-phospho-beta-glucosidase/beta-galactosidase